MLNEMIIEIIQLVLIPLVGILTTYLVKFLKAKAEEIKNGIQNDELKKYIDIITETVSNCVIATNQTYVDELKKQGKFDKEAQQIAFQKTLDAVLAILSDDAKNFIKMFTNDLEAYLIQIIESQVAMNKIKE